MRFRIHATTHDAFHTDRITFPWCHLNRHSQFHMSKAYNTYWVKCGLSCNPIRYENGNFRFDKYDEEMVNYLTTGSFY